MLKTEVIENTSVPLSPEVIRAQLELILQDAAFRSSKRSIQFLRFVVEKTLNGEADQIKERTIGVEVFGRSPSYDTNEDHVVRTAASELRKRLIIYYAEEKHRSELRMSLVPGSYVPQFKFPEQSALSGPETDSRHELAELVEPLQLSELALQDEVLELPVVGIPEKQTRSTFRIASFSIAAAVIAVILLFSGYNWLKPKNPQELFWQPVLETPGSVLLAVGDVPNGPPTSAAVASGEESSLPIVQKTRWQILPFGDAVTLARVLGVLQSTGKKVVIRREDASSFADLREGAVVLIGAFNNEWSLRLTRDLRYSLALDSEKHLIYIKDAKNPLARTWSWATNVPTDHQGGAGRPPLQDFALVSRIRNSDTGHVVIVIGGLYTYGTEAAGEFLTDPQLMQAIAKSVPLSDTRRNLQIVLGTTVTDDAAGPPRVLAVSSE